MLMVHVVVDPHSEGILHLKKSTEQEDLASDQLTSFPMTKGAAFEATIGRDGVRMWITGTCYQIIQLDTLKTVSPNEDFLPDMKWPSCPQ